MSVEDDIIDEISRKADYRRVVNTPFGPWVLLEIHPKNGGGECVGTDYEVNKIKTIPSFGE